MGPGLRLWRARRRRERIDAVLTRTGAGWVLEYIRNDRSMLTREYRSAKTARADANARLQELLRAGWIDHW